MARKDWFYIPLPLEQAKALDQILNTKECEKYGIVERAELIRLILGEFLVQYERCDRDLVHTLRDAFNSAVVDNEFIENSQ